MKQETETWNLMQDLITKVSSEDKKTADYTFAMSDRLDAIMKEKGISQRELARMTGKRPSEVTRWLSGTHNFTLATIAKLSVALGHDFVAVK